MVAYGFCFFFLMYLIASRTRPVLINLPNATSLTEDSDTATVVFVTSVFDPDVRDVHTFTMTVSPNDGSFSFDTSSKIIKYRCFIYTNVIKYIVLLFVTCRCGNLRHNHGQEDIYSVFTLATSYLN